jgi:hypothetical protein
MIIYLTENKRCFSAMSLKALNTCLCFCDYYVARYIWSLIAHIMGANCRPSSFDRFWIWVNRYISNNKKIHYVGLSAICWPVWKTRKAIHFEKKQIKSPTEIICLASSFLTYWAGLSKEIDKQVLAAGAEAMKEATLHFHPAQDTETVDNGTVLLQ